jgi:short subunit dehydrogenase-like uncharacterized protein
MTRKLILYSATGYTGQLASEFRAGFQTPATLFGSSFATTIADTRISGYKAALLSTLARTRTLAAEGKL